MSVTDEVARLVRLCDEMTRDGAATRPVAMRLVSDLGDGQLLRRLAAEYLVDALARARRSQALDVERESAVTPERMPRKGTRARAEWEQTAEGRAWVQQEESDWLRSVQMVHGVVQHALSRYVEDLRIQWTADLLDSTFSLSDGTMATWGEATVEQHEARRQMFLSNAHANLEGAARHELAVRELRESGAINLRDMVAGRVVPA